MIQHVDHINIVVNDLEKSVAFYTKVLGLQETRRARLEGDWIDRVAGLDGVSAEVVYVEPPNGGPRIELIQYHAPEGADFAGNAKANTRGLRHIAFRVQNIEEVVKRLNAAGVECLHPPITVPTGVVQHDAGEKRLCYFLDPDGALLELAEYQ